MLFSQHNRTDAKYFLQFQYDKNTGGEYYDSDGNGVHIHQDSTTFPGYTRNYSFELSRHIFEISGGYEVLKNLDIIGGTQLHYYSLQENFTTDTVIRDVKRAELTDTRFANFEIGANYYLHKTNDFLRLKLSSRLPFSQSDTDIKIENSDDFLSSNPYEILAGIDGGLFADKFYFGGEFLYNYRSGDFSDLMIFGGTFGLSTVENTMLKITARYIMPLEENPNKSFNIRQFPAYENYLDFGFGFWILFSEKYYAQFDYKLRPYGVSAWNSGTVNFVMGVNF
jgi:hypothetical protein